MDGTTYPLKAPFIVMATQNPIEMEGTQGQRDRFMARISMGWAELTLLDSHSALVLLEHLTAVTDADTINRVVATVTQVHASPAVRPTSSTSSRSRSTTTCASGPPRVRGCTCSGLRAQAALEGRDHVIPDDVQSLAVAVLSHRLMPSSETGSPGGRPPRSSPTCCGRCRCRPAPRRTRCVRFEDCSRRGRAVGAGLTLSLAASSSVSGT